MYQIRSPLKVVQEIPPSSVFIFFLSPAPLISLSKSLVRCHPEVPAHHSDSLILSMRAIVIILHEYPFTVLMSAEISSGARNHFTYVFMLNFVSCVERYSTRHQRFNHSILSCNNRKLKEAGVVAQTEHKVVKLAIKIRCLQSCIPLRSFTLRLLVLPESSSPTLVRLRKGLH